MSFPHSLQQNHELGLAELQSGTIEFFENIPQDGVRGIFVAMTQDSTTVRIANALNSRHLLKATSMEEAEAA